MKTAKLGSSSNANKDHYAKFNFKGGKDCRERLNEISGSRNLVTKTIALMSDIEWKEFCKNRRNAS